MKVNMTPNPLDVVTIHASQGDTEARQWEFELHNNGELIDTSDVKEQMVFKAYKGGTEQLLPENTSTPTTSPFKGDIRYPQGLLADQEFTYRQSPTEEDGLAKITDIKGNTLNWNQLVPIDWVPTRTFSDGLSVTNNNDGTYTINGTATQSRFPATSTEIKGIQGHKYYIQLLSSQNKAVISQNLSTVYVYSSVIYTAQNNNAFIIYFNTNTYSNEKIVPMIIDLTQMGLDSITTIQEFTSLFPLSYYSYNQGSLLSFNGNGIKTVGKNQLNPSVFNGVVAYTVNDDGSLTVNASDPRAWTNVSTFHLKKGNYIFTRSVPNGVCDIRFEYENYATNHLVQNQVASYPFTVTQDADVKIKIGYSYPSYPFTINAMIRFADTDDTFEPYTSSTLSLPISTYFPTGMKSAGSVYDELTESKAITRIGSVDLGSLTWDYISEIPIFQATITGGRFTRGQDLPCDMYSNSGYMSSANMPNMTYQVLDNGTLWIKNTSYTSASAFKTAMSGVYLYYELATYNETEFTTASLVTENTEIPLSNEDGTLIGKCTEQLSENPGFFDAKIKLSDADGECYSNKIQLHVERSPQ